MRSCGNCWRFCSMDINVGQQKLKDAVIKTVFKLKRCSFMQPVDPNVNPNLTGPKPSFIFRLYFPFCSIGYSQIWSEAYGLGLSAHLTRTTPELAEVATTNHNLKSWCILSLLDLLCAGELLGHYLFFSSLLSCFIDFGKEDRFSVPGNAILREKLCEEGYCFKIHLL